MDQSTRARTSKTGSVIISSTSTGYNFFWRMEIKLEGALKHQPQPRPRWEETVMGQRLETSFRRHAPLLEMITNLREVWSSTITENPTKAFSYHNGPGCGSIHHFPVIWYCEYSQFSLWRSLCAGMSGKWHMLPQPGPSCYQCFHI